MVYPGYHVGMSSMAVISLIWWALVVLGIVALVWLALMYARARTDEHFLDELLADGLIDKDDYLRRRKLLHAG